jgi:hypothetical protein
MTTTLSPLHGRLLELSISPAELSQLVSRSESEVETWLTAKTLPGDARVLTRFLSTDADALRRVDQLRRTQTLGKPDAVVFGGVPERAYATTDTGKIDGNVVK